MGHFDPFGTVPNRVILIHSGTDLFMLDVYEKLVAAEGQMAEGKILDGNASLKNIREKY